MKDLQKEFLEILLMVTALVLLLFLAHALSKLGVFDPLPLTRQTQPPLLVALTPTHSSPGYHPYMEMLFTAASSRGVQEESNVMESTQSTTLSRGQRIAIYSGLVKPFSTYPAFVGVILDTGAERVTSQTCQQWTERLTGKGIDGLKVCIVEIGEGLCVPAKWDGKWSEKVAVWRAYRKLERRWNRVPEKRGLPNVIVHAYSKKSKRSVAVLPIDCTKNVIVG